MSDLVEGAPIDELDERLDHTYPPEQQQKRREARERETRNGRMVLTCLADVEPERVEWLWEHRIPRGKLTLLMGMGGEGKTWVAMDMAARVSTGRPWPDQRDVPSKPGRVLIFTSEDGIADTIAPRLIAHEADLTRIEAVEAVREVDKQGTRSFNLQADIALLSSTVKNLGDVDLIIFDALNSYMGGGRFDAHKDADVRGVLEPLCKLAERRRIAIIGIGHLSKADHDRAMNKFCGSIAYINVARAAWLISRDQEDDERRLMLSVKMNIAKPAPNLAFSIEAGRVLWHDGTVEITADEAVNRAADGEAASSVDEAAEYLQRALADGAARTTVINNGAKQLGISTMALKRARKRLGVVSEASHASGRTVWFLSLPFDPVTHSTQTTPSLDPLTPSLSLNNASGSRGSCFPVPARACAHEGAAA